MTKWLLPDEAAKRLGLKAPTVRWLCDTRKLPCTRTIGGAKVRLISEKAVEKLREQRQQAHQGEQ